MRGLTSPARQPPNSIDAALTQYKWSNALARPILIINTNVAQARSDATGQVRQRLLWAALAV